MIGAIHPGAVPGAGIRSRSGGVGMGTLWMLLFVAANLLLYIPYTTGAMPWFYQEGYVPVQPAVYMAAFGSLAIGLGLLRRPEFALPALLVFALVGARAGDAAFIRRFVFPGEQGEYVFYLMSVGFMAGVSAVTVGLMRKVSAVPVVVIAAVTVVVCNGMNLYEFFGFGDYSTVEGRAAGFLEDPNNSAIAITLMLGVFLTCHRGFWLGALMVGLSGAGVLVTLSRSGILVYLVMLVAWVVLNFRENLRKLAIIAAVAVPLGSMGVGAMMTFSQKAAGVRGDANVEGRLAALFGGDLDKMGSGERSKDLMDGLEGVASAPIAGLGTGAGTGLYMPHNQLVAVWIDTGVVGLLLYGGLLAVLVWKCLAAGGRGVLCLVPVVGYVPFSQMLLELTVYWLAVFVLLSVTTVRFFGVSLLGRRSFGGGGGASPTGQLVPVHVRVSK